MSMETWKAEFYPVDAWKVPEDEAVAHSLQKWIGLRLENLEKHDVELAPNFRVVHEPGTTIGLGINDDTCALCFHHYHESQDGTPICSGCPLKKHTGLACGFAESAWEDFVHYGSVNPMIEALHGALVKEGA